MNVTNVKYKVVLMFGVEMHVAHARRLCHKHRIHSVVVRLSLAHVDIKRHINHWISVRRSGDMSTVTHNCLDATVN